MTAGTMWVCSGAPESSAVLFTLSLTTKVFSVPFGVLHHSEEPASQTKSRSHTER